MKENYDLQYELGPINQYDELAGRAQLLGAQYKDLYLIELGTILANLIRKHKYSSDKFYLVIAKAKEIQKYLNLLENETLSLEDLLISDGGEFNSNLRLTTHGGVTTLAFGTHRYNEYHNAPLSPKIIDEISKIITSEFPFFLDKQTEIVEDYREYYGGANTYKVAKDIQGMPLYEIVNRIHESQDEFGNENNYYFPKEISIEKIKIIFNRIKSYLESIGFTISPETFGTNKNKIIQKRLQAESQGIPFELVIFNEAVDEALRDADYKFSLFRLNSIIQRYLQDEKIPLKSYIDLYKRIIQKISQELPSSEVESIKEKLQKQLRAKKHFLELSEELKKPEVSLEIKEFEVFLKKIGVIPTSFTDRYLFEFSILMSIKELKKQIQNQYPNLEIIDFAFKGNDGFFIKFKPNSSDKIFIYKLKGNIRESIKIYEEFLDLV